MLTPVLSLFRSHCWEVKLLTYPGCSFLVISNRHSTVADFLVYCLLQSFNGFIWDAYLFLVVGVTVDSYQLGLSTRWSVVLSVWPSYIMLYVYWKQKKLIWSRVKTIHTYGDKLKYLEFRNQNLLRKCHKVYFPSRFMTLSVKSSWPGFQYHKYISPLLSKP